MNFSNLQLSIFKAIKHTDNDICVIATAGSGKTTTIVEASKQVPKNLDSLFLAFNKRIVEELTSKLPSHIECSTLHSKGIRSLNKTYGKLKLSDNKTFFLAEPIVKNKKLNEKQKLILRFRLSDVMNYVRLHLVEKSTLGIENVCIRHGLEFDDLFVNDCLELWEILDEYNSLFRYESTMIDYTDMIYLPVTDPDVTLDQYDIIFVDEGQDLNKCQHKFVRMLSKKGRVVLVGDKNQAIYAFCGADIDMFEEFEKSKNTLSLPLSISYRCPKAIVAKAKEVYSTIEQWEGQEEGIVRDGVEEEIDDHDFVLARNLRPLVTVFFRLLERGKKAEIVGNEILEAIKRELENLKTLNVDDAVDKMLERLGRIKAELEKKNVKSPLKHPKFTTYQEKIQIVRHLIKWSHVTTVSSLLKEFDLMLKSKGTIKLMTIHKSKGLENNRVFLIEAFEGKRLIPSKYAVTPKDLVQENNLLFVAYTRAMKELILIKNVM